MKYVYLTVDIEEWYDLEYLKDYDLKAKGFNVVPRIIGFLDMLDKLQIKATFFVIADLLDNNADIIREIADRGHSLGCHGLDHQLLNEKSGSEFFREISKARGQIQQAAGVPVMGYRAPCFSMEREKLELVQAAGFTYDSSKILFAQHPLYRNLDLTGFDKIDDLVYFQDGFFEYEIPTVQLGNYNVPISGGGYLRLLPYLLIKFLVKKYSLNHENFLIYVHPFELTDKSLPLPSGIGLKDRFRISVGRRNNLQKLYKLILMLQEMGAEFRTLPQDLELRKFAGVKGV